MIFYFPKAYWEEFLVSAQLAAEQAGQPHGSAPVLNLT
jgi:hypothetical protein